MPRYSARALHAKIEEHFSTHEKEWRTQATIGLIVNAHFTMGVEAAAQMADFMLEPSAARTTPYVITQCYGLGGEDPQCDILLQYGGLSVSLLGGIDEDTDAPYVIFGGGTVDARKRAHDMVRAHEPQAA